MPKTGSRKRAIGDPGSGYAVSLQLRARGAGTPFLTVAPLDVQRTAQPTVIRRHGQDRAAPPERSSACLRYRPKPPTRNDRRSRAWRSRPRAAAWPRFIAFSPIRQHEPAAFQQLINSCAGHGIAWRCGHAATAGSRTPPRYPADGGCPSALCRRDGRLRRQRG